MGKRELQSECQVEYADRIRPKNDNKLLVARLYFRDMYAGDSSGGSACCGRLTRLKNRFSRSWPVDSHTESRKRLICHPATV
jgi:hypothetical protein